MNANRRCGAVAELRPIPQGSRLLRSAFGVVLSFFSGRGRQPRRLAVSGLRSANPDLFPAENFTASFGGGKALTADFSLELLIPKGLSLRRVPNRTRPDSVRASSFARPFRRASASLFYSLCRAVAKIGNCRDGRRTGVVIKIGAAGANERTKCRRSVFFDKAGWVKAL